MTEASETVAVPPWPTGPDGSVRRVGVEIEFGGLAPLAAAEVLRARLGGTLAVSGDFHATVKDSRLGDVALALDTRFAEPFADEGEMLAAIRKSLVNLAVGVIPTEATFAPVPWQRLGGFADAVDALRQAGAKGTAENPSFGFGVHLNVQTPSREVAAVLAIFRAYLRMETLLRSEMRIDPTRRLLPFIDPFPEGYRRRVLADDYAPELSTFIADYCAANPTRNRGLDLLPLLAAIDPAAVEKALGEAPKAARPAFHYRLPNTNLGDPRWSIVTEWNRWVGVERHAAREWVGPRRNGEGPRSGTRERGAPKTAP